MIRTFKHKGLERFFKKGDHRGIIAKTEERTDRILDRLDTVVRAEDMNIPGFKFHPLQGELKGTYAVTVTKNWRITFKFDDQDAIDVNLEDYH
jgi:proteic killer suppression protein